LEEGAILVISRGGAEENLSYRGSQDTEWRRNRKEGGRSTSFPAAILKKIHHIEEVRV